MSIVRALAIGAFLVAVPVFLITTNVRWVINTPLLYSYGFNKYDIPDRTGIERDELLSAGRQIRDYFNNRHLVSMRGWVIAAMFAIGLLIAQSFVAMALNGVSFLVW